MGKAGLDQPHSRVEGIQGIFHALTFPVPEFQPFSPWVFIRHIAEYNRLPSTTLWVA
jgi:hypothetical protein